MLLGGHAGAKLLHFRVAAQLRILDCLAYAGSDVFLLLSDLHPGADSINCAGTLDVLSERAVARSTTADNWSCERASEGKAGAWAGAKGLESCAFHGSEC